MNKPLAVAIAEAKSMSGQAAWIQGYLAALQQVSEWIQEDTQTWTARLEKQGLILGSVIHDLP